MNQKDINIISIEITDPIATIEENLAKNCYKQGRYHCPIGLYYRRPSWKRLSKDKGIGSVLLRIKEHPHEKRDSISDALNIGRGTCGEYVQILLKAELISWTRKNHYDITPLGLVILKFFDLI